MRFLSSTAPLCDPLMGWTGSADTQKQVTLYFANRAAAVRYAKQHGVRLIDAPAAPSYTANIRKGGYADNFKTHKRGGGWTH